MTISFSWHASCALAENNVFIHGGYDGNVIIQDSHIFNLGKLILNLLINQNVWDLFDGPSERIFKHDIIFFI